MSEYDLHFETIDFMFCATLLANSIMYFFFKMADIVSNFLTGLIKLICREIG